MNQPPASGTLFGHPKGLFLLFSTEMWERFSYYGMRALLILTLVAATESTNPGFGLSNGDALLLYGYYTGLVYAATLFGGLIADNMLGQRKSIILGGALMAIGQYTLFAATPHSMSLFYVGLGFIIAGNGLFKPNISAIVGDLYPQGDARRDGGFTIFYMGINLGAFIAPLVTSSLGESDAFGWRYGYLAAGIGMTLSVVIQLLFAQKYLGDLGKVPGRISSRNASGTPTPLTKVEFDRLRVVLFLFVFVTMFWLAFEQAGGLMSLFAAEHTDRMVGAFEVPAGWFQSLNPLFILMFAPLFAWLWVKLNAMNKQPDAPIKILFGMLLTSIGFIFLIVGVFEMQVNPSAKSSMMWLTLAFLFHTLGELCISPVGLSLMTKLAPVKLASLVMGVWFLMPAVAHYLAGFVGAYSDTAGDNNAVVEFAASFGVQAAHAGLLVVFGGIAVALVFFAALLWMLSGTLVRWMHGAERMQS
ncbi:MULTISPECIES: peptide MFS transporter [Rheinheimera]|uniref:peptide MFS transporter n=1 Tax=Rheinheimera TaxID=67575 RepID=UPI001E3CAF0D|nr:MULTISPECIES: peptide MFS transporter [Rheinheimera]MDF3125644.1 peptide MFS transporter [Rheinheimera sp. 1928-s]